MHDSRTPHMTALKYIIRCVQGTLLYGLHLYSTLVHTLLSYIDADWGTCSDTRRSTSGYCIYLSDNLISWFAKCQPTLFRSSVEGEHRGVANVVFKSCWLCNLLLVFHRPITKVTFIYYDSVSIVSLSNNPININAPSILK